MPSKKSPAKPYFQDLLYKRMLSAYQEGAWDKSEKFLVKLLKKYPNESELESTIKEIVLRKKIDADARVEAGKAKKKTLRRIIYTVLALTVITTVAVVAYDDYSVQLQQQIEALSLERSLASNFEDARNFLRAGRPNEARTLLEQISEIDQDYPQLEETLLLVEYQLELEGQYAKANGQLQDGEYTAAFESLTELFQIDPNFKDVSILLNSLELRKNLSIELLAAAEEAYFLENWITAISNYEQAAENDPSIIGVEYRTRLFESYIAESESLLVGQNVGLNDVSLAEEYFRNGKDILLEEDEEALGASAKLDSIAALIVQNYFRIAQTMLDRDADSVENLETVISILGKSLLIDPSDNIARLQYDLAKSFLLGQENVALELWEEAIESLEFVYLNNQEYGEGTARQLLYEAQSSLGWKWLEESEYDLALADFEIARDIAMDDPAALFRLYESQVNVAHTLGQMELYGEASSVYFSAVFVLKFKSNFSAEAEEAVENIYAAEILAFNGDFEGAHEQYIEALSQAELNYNYVNYIIQEGDYLAQIARRFLSTVAAIKGNNTFSDTNEIFLGQRLSIPVLVE